MKKQYIFNLYFNFISEFIICAWLIIKEQKNALIITKRSLYYYYCLSWKKCPDFEILKVHLNNASANIWWVTFWTNCTLPFIKQRKSCFKSKCIQLYLKVQILAILVLIRRGPFYFHISLVNRIVVVRTCV